MQGRTLTLYKMEWVPPVADPRTQERMSPGRYERVRVGMCTFHKFVVVSEAVDGVKIDKVRAIVENAVGIIHIVDPSLVIFDR